MPIIESIWTVTLQHRALFGDETTTPEVVKVKAMGAEFTSDWVQFISDGYVVAGIPSALVQSVVKEEARVDEDRP